MRRRRTGRNACAIGSQILVFVAQPFLAVRPHAMTQQDESSLIVSYSPRINNAEARQRRTGRNACATRIRSFSGPEVAG